MSALGVSLHDSAAFTDGGRALLVYLGVVDPDPLRVEAERWLASHRGPATEATVAVRAALGPAWPLEWVEAADRFRNTPWKGTLR